MRNEKNYYELCVHHFATVFSIVYCYFTNFEDFGTFILIASDFGDAVLNLGKVYRDISGGGNNSLFADFFFAFIMLNWFVTRNIFLFGCFARGVQKFLPFTTITLANPDHLPIL